MEAEDRTLVERCLAGDDGAFALLLRRHQGPVFNLVVRMVGNREDASEISQDAFVRAYQALPRFDPQYAFRAWILKIASNLSIDFLRRKRPITVSLDAPLECKEGTVPRELPAAGVDPHKLTAEREAVGLVEEAMGRLDPRHRQVLILLYQQHLSYEEIAQLLDEPLGTIKARIHRARRALREQVAPHLTEEELP